MSRLIAAASIVAVVAAVAAGLYVAGSPAEQRLLRLDERRVADVGQLNNAILRHWRQTESLPESLSELVDGRLLSRLPKDPETEASYAYAVTGPRTFELCAEFVRPSRREDAEDFWYHDAGRECYSFDLSEHVLR